MRIPVTRSGRFVNAFSMRSRDKFPILFREREFLIYGVTKLTGNPRLQLSQFRASSVRQKKRYIKEEEDASSRSYDIFNYRITF